MISSYRLFATTKAEIKQTGYDRLLCRSRLLRLYAGHPHPHQIDYPLHSPAALTGLPPIFYNPVLQHFGHPLRNGPDTTSARRMSVINRGSTLGWRSSSRPPADSAAGVSTQSDLRTAHQGKGVRLRPSSAYPCSAQITVRRSAHRGSAWPSEPVCRSRTGGRCFHPISSA